MTWALASRPRISSSARTRSGPVISGSPEPAASSGRSPRSRASWTGWSAAAVTVRAACDCPAARARTSAARSTRRRRPRAARAARGPGHRALPPVELGDVEEDVAPGHPPAPAEPGPRRPHPVERVETSCEHELLDDRAADAGAPPEVAEVDVRLAGDDPLDLRPADPGDVGERDADAPGRAVRQVRVERHVLGPDRHPLHPVGRVRGVDVEREDGDPEGAGVVEDEPLGVHAGVVGEDAGDERRRVVGLEPRRVVGREGECRRVRLAEAEAREGLEDLPDRVDVLRRVAAGGGCRAPPALDLLLPGGLPIARRTSSAWARETPVVSATIRRTCSW